MTGLTTKPPQLPDLPSLQLLVDIGVMGSLGRAAHRAGISQPAASKRLSRLERELQLSLVHRSASGSQLTGEGQAVAGWAQQVLDSVGHLQAAAGSLRAGGEADLRVAASVTIAGHLIPRWLCETRAAHPELHIGLQVANSRQVQGLVLDGHADVGFVEGPHVDPRLCTRPVTTDRLAVVVAPGHPWASRRLPLQRAELARTPLVVREHGSGTRLTLEEALGGERAEPLLELGSNEAVKCAVAAGAGPAVLSELAIHAEVATGYLVELPVAGLALTRELAAVWRRGTRLSEPSKWLLAAAYSAPSAPSH
ncbi:MAG: LysR family transcriptional regulator [Acidimicrobiales bacterium]